MATRRMDAREVIAALGLQPLPAEGGLFRETYRSVEATSTVEGVERPLCTAIYYLLDDEPDSFSAMHRLPGDEIYHFYLGDPLELLLLYPDGTSRQVVLGQDLRAGHQLQVVVPGGVWQGSRLAAGGRYALVGTTMSPGFLPSDYEGGRKEDLIAAYPSQRERIQGLTRA